MKVKIITTALMIIFLTSCSSVYVSKNTDTDGKEINVIDLNNSNIVNSPYFEFKESEGEVISPNGIHVSSVISIDDLLSSEEFEQVNVASSIKAQDEAKEEILARIQNGESLDTSLDDSLYGRTSGEIAKNATNQSFTYINSSSSYQESIAIYTYVEGRIYEIVTSVNAITDFRLKPGEQISGEPIVNDGGVYWNFTMGVSIENGVEVQHLFIKPTTVGLDTSMIILTNQRTYYFRIASFSSSHMTAVKFQYPGDFDTGVISTGNSVSDYISNTGTTTGYLMNMTEVDYSYTIKNHRGNPSWKPQTVFSDSAKTCIQFPVSIANSTELPSVYLVLSNGSETLVNYHIASNLYIIDTVLVGRQYFLLKSGAQEQVKILRK